MSTTNEEVVPVWLRELCERLQSDDQALLTVVNLNLRRISHRWMTILCEAMRAKKTPLSSLNLTSSLINRLDISSTQVLQPLVQDVLPFSTTSPHVLHLSYNRLTGPLDGLGRSLSMNTSLIELHLDHNFLDCASAIELAKGLEVNQTLQVLQLAYNLIGDKGASKLALALVHNRCLRSLVLSRNEIGIAGGQDLVDALWVHKNTSLTMLDLRNNQHVPTEILGWLAACCQANAVGRSVLLDTDHCLLPGIAGPILDRGAKSPSVLYLLLQESHSAILERALTTDRPLKRLRMVK